MKRYQLSILMLIVGAACITYLVWPAAAAPEPPSSLSGTVKYLNPFSDGGGEPVKYIIGVEDVIGQVNYYQITRSMYKAVLKKATIDTLWQPDSMKVVRYEDYKFFIAK